MKVTIHTDGGARGNPGRAGVGVLLVGGDGRRVEHGRVIGTATNNVAEYTAIVDALDLVEEHVPEATELAFFLDSELVQRQLTGRYKVKDARMKALHADITAKLRAGGRPYTFTHVRRELNTDADRFYNEALDGKR